MPAPVDRDDPDPLCLRGRSAQRPLSARLRPDELMMACDDRPAHRPIG
jgi:hypothetical protein